MAATAATAATSSFDTGREGWRAIGDTEGVLDWLPSGGNPDGHISVTDSASGGVIYFVAPASFLGDRTVAIGTFLSFDLQQVYSGAASQFDREDVILEGAGLRVVFDTPVNPANGSWTSYTVPLIFSQWRLDSLTGATPTEAQFASVMGDLTSLQIRAEYRSGPDVGKLDNVSLVPEPAAALLLLGGLAGLGCLKGYRHKGARGCSEWQQPPGC
jgi:hypothetical protein